MTVGGQHATTRAGDHDWQIAVNMGLAITETRTQCEQHAVQQAPQMGGEDSGH